MVERSGRGRRVSDRKMEVQMELLKVIAEQNHEKLFEYNADTDKASIYMIKDGSFDKTIIYDDFSFKIEEYMKFCPNEDVELFKENFNRCVRKPSHATFEMRLNYKRGRLEWVRVFLASIDEPDGNVKFVAGRIASIQKEKDAEIEIRRKAENDALTGLYNHTTFEDLCEKKLREYDGEVIFVMLDVDDFKIINDTLGHNVGDLILGQTGYALRLVTLDNGYAGRLGGDEFAIMVWGLDSRMQIKEFCRELIANLKNIIFDMEYSASIGISIRDGRNLTFKDMYFEADQAVYYSKKNGKNQIVCFDEISDIEEGRKIEIVTYPGQEKFVSGYERFALNICNEYAFVLNVSEKRVVFANEAAKGGSRLAIQIFDECVSKPVPDPFIDTLIENYESGMQYSIYFGGQNTFLDDIYKGCMLMLRAVYVSKENIIRLYVTNLNDNMHLNQVMGRESGIVMGAKKCIAIGRKLIAGNTDTDEIFKDSLSLLYSFYNCDVAALLYNTSDGYRVSEVHNDNSNTLAKLLNESVISDSIKEFKALCSGDNEHILIGNIQMIKDKHPILYSKLVDGRISSLVSLCIGDCKDDLGRIIVFNPKDNAQELAILEFTAKLLAEKLAG